MPPKLKSDDGKHIVIRPLSYVPEKYLEKYSEQMEFPIIPCNLCGSQENLQRNAMKALLQDWEKKFPGRVESLFSSLQNIVPSHLMDLEEFDFKNLTDSSGSKDLDEQISWQPIQLNL
jgi:tRNA 2-thiocytidine biosynthesis protein TtcA